MCDFTIDKAMKAYDMCFTNFENNTNLIKCICGKVIRNRIDNKLRHIHNHYHKKRLCKYVIDSHIYLFNDDIESDNKHFTNIIIENNTI